MTDRQVHALAAFLAEGRRDWDAPGIVTALRAARERYDAWQLATAMIRRATDGKNLSPVLQPFDFDDTPVRCRTHPTAGTRRDGTCGGCFADAHAAEIARLVNEPVAPPSAWVQARRAIERRPA